VTTQRLRSYALGKPGAWPDQPWDGDDVAKVGEGDAAKIFTFLGPESIGVKCGTTRDEADAWLDRYPDDAKVMPYIGRSGWNTLSVGGAIPDDELLEAVDESYRLVVVKLPRKHRPEGWDG
jgi:predicted DNA-binding protein (MmcQ/YjbR family)